MTALSFLNRHAEMLEHVLGYRSEVERKRLDRAQTSLDPFTITLARQAGTPAAEVAEEVGRRLGWEVYDGELTRRIAEQLDLPVAIVERMDEKPQSWLVECLEAFSSCRPPSERRYFRCLLRIVQSLGERGRCVILGRGAGFMLPARSTLRVRLVGSREDCTTALGRLLHLDRAAAARRGEQINRERSRFVRDHFLVDPSKARNYDLVLNASQWSVDSCADFILQALQHKVSEQATA
jgi:cytidylate kinase